MAGLLVAVLYWPYLPAVTDLTGLDPSWGVAIHMAALGGLDWGSDVAFTYGPLGFLAVPFPFFGVTSLLALAGCLLVHTATAAMALYHASRLFPLWVAVVAAALVARMFLFLPLFESLFVLAWVGAIGVVGRPRSDWHWVAIGGGLLAAVALLGKLNIGLYVGAIGVLASCLVTRPWWRGPALFTIAALGGSLALWVASGQELRDLRAFALSSLDLLTGYSEAMGADTLPGIRLGYALFAVCVGLLVAGGVLAARRRPLGERLVLAGIGALFAFFVWRTSFTRADTHVLAAFAIAGLAVLPVSLGHGDRRLAAATLGVVVLSFVAVSRLSPLGYLAVGESVRSFAGQVAAVVPGAQAAATEATRRDLRAAYRLEEPILAALEGRTVHVDPWEAGIAFAYPSVRWSPLPLFQSYAAFTPTLDGMNAIRLRAPDAPERILRQHPDVGPLDAIDRRNRWYESPAATLEIVCRYEELVSSARWQVLARTGRACGPAEVLATVTARAGETVEVPREARPDRVVIARVSGFAAGPFDRLRTLAWKAAPWYVTVDTATRYRLVPATAAAGLLMAVPASTTDDPEFAFGPPTESLMIDTPADGPARTAPLTFEFLSLSLAR